MNVTFLVDGFNLYHSIEDLENYEGIKAKWLDIKTLFRSYFPYIGKDTKFNGIYHFTAIRNHVQQEKPNSIVRHKRYISVLEAKGIEIIYGKFMPKTVNCKDCGKDFTAYEEKKTDVAIASKLIELAHDKHSDVYVIVSGDTDLIPAIQLAKQIDPNCLIMVMFPYRRKNKELISVVDRSFVIKPKRYQESQFQGSMPSAQGAIYKPSGW